MSEFKFGDIVTTKGYAERGQYYTYLSYDENSLGARHRVLRHREGVKTSFSADANIYKVFPADSAETNNPTSPSVYKFPKAEVRDISAYLTSYGGQVVQYVARSTRLDGLYKDDRVQDLEKAKLMIQWEIDRLKELQK